MLGGLRGFWRILKKGKRFNTEINEVGAQGYTEKRVWRGQAEFVTWEAEPGWDTVTVVSSFKVLASKQSQYRAVVSVKWCVLEYAESRMLRKTKNQKLLTII